MNRIHTEIYGQGQALVLIHGWSMHTGLWRPFAQHLGRYFQVICVDLPGHGRSEMIEPFNLELISTALIAAIPVKRFHLLGWSLGAAVAMDIVGRFPDRVASLMVLAGNPQFVQQENWPGMKLEALQAFADNLQLNSEMTLMRFLALQVKGLANGKTLFKQLKHAVQECRPARFNALKGGLEILRDSDFTDTIRNAGCPVSFVIGDKDSLIPRQTLAAVNQIRPDAEAHLLKNAGHLPFLSHQQHLFKIIKSFCAPHVS